MSFIEFYVKLYVEIKSFNEMPPKFLKSIDPTPDPISCVD